MNITFHNQIRGIPDYVTINPKPDYNFEEMLI